MSYPCYRYPALQRKATLLQEYRQRGRAGLFIDRRFGANDEDTPEGEKAIVRFQKERMVRTCDHDVS